MLDKMARLARQLAITMYQKYLDAYKKEQQAASLADLCAGSACQGPLPPYDCDLCPSTSYGGGDSGGYGGPPPYTDSGADTASSYGGPYGDGYDGEGGEEDYDDSEEYGERPYPEDDYYGHGSHHGHGHDNHHGHAHADPVSGYGMDYPGTKLSSGDGKKIAIIQMK
jgi:hypothetical protein